MKRPHAKPFDRLLAPAATAGEIAADYATQPFDRVARQMEQRWGIDRLVGLQTPEVAAKFGARMGQLNDAINAGDPDKAAELATICIANLRRMDEIATAAGHKPMPPEVWEFDFDGERFTILRDGDLWPVLRALRGDDVRYFTMREVAHALKAKIDGTWIDEIRSQFPGAEVNAIRRTQPETELEKSINDFVPF